MQFDPKDPVWTEYVEKRLVPGRRVAVELFLSDSPDARAWVAHLHAKRKQDELILMCGSERKARRLANRRRWAVGLWTVAVVLGGWIGVQVYHTTRSEPISQPLVFNSDGGAAATSLRPRRISGASADFAMPSGFNADREGGPFEVAAPSIAAFSMATADGVYFKSSDRGHLAANASSAMSASLSRTTMMTEDYRRIDDNPILTVAANPLSTFSIDVDTASYSNIRRFLNQQTLPPPDAVRTEEMINYFTYDYAPPTGEQPFAVHLEVGECSWRPEHRLVRIGLKGREMAPAKMPPSNLVFLIDVSGSMQDSCKLPLVQSALRLLVQKLSAHDRVAIVVYAGASGLVLPSTNASNQPTIIAAIDNLEAGGSTNGGEGIQLAYDIAVKNFIKGGNNRVILCTDGDFNVGVTNEGQLTRLIEAKAKTGVFLSVLGFGMGNYQDSTLESLADRGNGNYAYIDTLREARKVLVDQMTGSLFTIAKDVKIQVEFNPARVSEYRLVGYENRLLRAEDFNNDAKDAGEIGAGHTVTALYEVTPAGMSSGSTVPAIDPLKYQQSAPPRAEPSDELLTVKLRYKDPDGSVSKLISVPARDEGIRLAHASKDFRFVSAVASFGMILRNGDHKGNATFANVLELAGEAKGADSAGHRQEFIELVRQAQQLSAN